MEIPNEARTFLEGLLTDAGMTTLDATMREEMIKELYARLDNYLSTVIADHLQEADVEPFIKMNEEKMPKEEIEAYLKEKIPNSQEIFAKAFADFRALYLSDVAVSRNAPAEN